MQEKLGIGFAQFKLMHIITKYPSDEQQDLALYLGQTEASISRQVRLMQQMGLVNIDRDKKDSRKKRVTLTKKGKNYFEKAKKILESMHAQVTKNFKQTEVKQLQKLIDNMLIAVGCSEESIGN